MGASRSRGPALASGRATPSDPSIARALTLAILGVGLLAVLAANLPGQMSYDSVVQLADGRSGVYNTWHPAVMAWLLGLGDAVLPGVAIYTTAVAAVGFGALALLVADAPRTGWAAPVVAALLCASPLLLLEQGIVWKDVLFADAFVGAFALLASAGREGRSAGGRAARIAAACALLTLAVLVRQNGVVVLVFGAAAAGWLAWRGGSGRRSGKRTDRRPGGRRRRAALGAVLVLVGVAAAAAGAGALLAKRRAPGDVGQAGQLRLLKIYDLVGVARRAPAVDLSALQASGLDRHIRLSVPLYSPLKNDTIIVEPGVSAAVSEGAPGLDAAWRGALLHHPVAWLAHRLEVFRWIYAPPDVTRCTATYAGVDGPPEVLAQLGLHSEWRGQDLALSRYARGFVRTPLYSHAAWSVLAGVLLVLLARRGRTADGVVVAMLGAALAYAATFLLIGIACDHRYLYPLDLAGMAALLHLASDPSGVLRAGGLRPGRGAAPRRVPRAAARV